MSALAQIAQDDFAVGILRGVAPDVQPGVGVFNVLNGMFDDDGDIYRRGGSTYYSASGAGAAGQALAYLWTGFLSSKACVAIGHKTGMMTLSPTKQFVPLGGPPIPTPVLGAVVNDTLYLPNGIMWSGSLKAGYVGGSVNLTAGSAEIVGVGTAWVANVETGMFVEIGTSGSGQVYRVVKVTDDTHMTLDHPQPATVNGEGYTVNNHQSWKRPASLPPVGTLHLGAIAGRLVVASGNRVAFSEAEKPWSFVADDYHELSAGVVVQGLAPIRDTLLVFTNYGLWSVTNMSFNLTDAAGNIQQVLGVLAPELSLWHESGLCEWAGRVIAPCIDRVYMIDAMSAPVPISDSISPLYMQYVRNAFRPGGAKVFRNTLFLPIIKADGTPEIMLSCRVNRPIRGRYVYYPWAVHTGHVGGVITADVALIEQRPLFLAGHADGTVTSLTDVFAPSNTVARDANGVAFEFDVETRDFPTGNGQPNHVRKLRLRYTLENADNTEASITGGVSVGSRAQTYETVSENSTDYADVKVDYATYDEMYRGIGWASGLPPSAAEPDRFWVSQGPITLPEPGIDPAVWHFTRALRTRFIRARFRCEDPVARLVVHHVDLSVRPATHNR